MTAVTHGRKGSALYDNSSLDSTPHNIKNDREEGSLDMPPGNVVERRRFACHPLLGRQLAIYPGHCEHQ
jgi:hypothetical protein